MTWIVLAFPLLPGGVYLLVMGEVTVGVLALWQWLTITLVGVLGRS